MNTPEENTFLDELAAARKRHEDAFNPFKQKREEAAIDETEWPSHPFERAQHHDVDERMMPKILWNYAKDNAELLGISVSAVAMPAIVGMAALIDDKIKIQPKRHDSGWTESARLWTAVIGDPSARKTPALSKALAPMKRINGRLSAEYAAQMAMYMEAKGSAKKAKVEFTDDPPPKHRLIVGDTTIEALGELLKDNPSGMLMVHDELSGWIGSFDSYASAAKGVSRDRGYWLEAYNGGAVTVDRITRGEVYIPNWSVSIVGGIQPTVLKSVAKTMGSDGLLQRFMLFHVRSTGMEQDRAPDSAAAFAYNLLAEHLSTLEAGMTGPVILGDGAHRVRERMAIFSDEQTAYHGHSLALRGHYGKWTGLFARLLLTYHVIECAMDKAYPSDVPVSEATALLVERLMRGFLCPNADRFYASIDDSPLLGHLVRLAGFILLRGKEKISLRDITQGNKFWRSLNRHERMELMGRFVDNGWIAPEKSELGKDMSTHWLVNPKVFDGRFDAIKQSEMDRRDEATRRLRPNPVDKW